MTHIIKHVGDTILLPDYQDKINVNTMLQIYSQIFQFPYCLQWLNENKTDRDGNFINVWQLPQGLPLCSSELLQISLNSKCTRCDNLPQAA